MLGADLHANLYSCNAATAFPFVVEEGEEEVGDEDDDDEPFECTNFESVIIAPFVPRSHEAEARGIFWDRQIILGGKKVAVQLGNNKRRGVTP